MKKEECDLTRLFRRLHWDLRSAIPKPQTVCCSWDEMYERLRAFRMTHGHCNVDQGSPDGHMLAPWVSEQRELRLLGELSQDRILRLENLGFEWKWGRGASDARWIKMFSALLNFKTIYGHTNVPVLFDDIPGLWRWARNQGSLRNEARLSEDRTRLLDRIGFTWDFYPPMHSSKKQREHSSKKNWEQMYSELLAFKEAYGHCLVPYEYLKSPTLSLWVKRQRVTRKYLTENQIQRLTDIGFLWGKPDRGWKCIYFLTVYKLNHGHLSLDKHGPESIRILRSLDLLRKMKKRGELSNDQIQILDATGFPWDSKPRFLSSYLRSR